MRQPRSNKLERKRIKIKTCPTYSFLFFFFLIFSFDFTARTHASNIKSQKLCTYCIVECLLLSEVLIYLSYCYFLLVFAWARFETRSWWIFGDFLNWKIAICVVILIKYFVQKQKISLTAMMRWFTLKHLSSETRIQLYKYVPISKIMQAKDDAGIHKHNYACCSCTFELCMWLCEKCKHWK